MIPYFEYGAEANDYLRKKDKRLGSVMDAVGHIRGLRMVYRHKKLTANFLRSTGEDTAPLEV